MSLRFPEQAVTMAGHRNRLEELERRLPALNDDPPPDQMSCCDHFCLLQTGFVDLAPGGQYVALSLAIPRPQSGRISVSTGAAAQLSVDGDFYVKLQLSVGGVFYYPRRFARDQVAKAGDMFSLELADIAHDFHGPAADLVVAIRFVNLSSQHIIVSEASLEIDRRGRGGSIACQPLSSGSS